MRSERLREVQAHRFYQPWLDLQQFIAIDTGDQHTPFHLNHADTTPKASQDKALTAFAQLATLRLNVRRAMISLIDSSNQYILAEATKSLSLASEKRHKQKDALWLGSAIVPRESAVCHYAFTDLYQVENDEGTMVTRQACVVPDMRLDDRFRERDYVLKGQMQFYAGVPIKTRTGVRIGVYAVSHDKPRAPLDIDEVLFMEDAASAVFEHLELVKARQASVKGDRMVQGITSFIEGKFTIGGLEGVKDVKSVQEQPTDLAVPSNEGSPPADEKKSHRLTDTGGISIVSDMKHLFNRAARIIRESTPADGVLFLDASTGAIGQKVNGLTGAGSKKSDDDDGDTDGSRGDYSSAEHSNYHSHSGGDTTQSDSDGGSMRQSMSNILGMSLGEASPNAERLRSADFSFSLKDLEHCIETYPRGKIFGLPGYDSSSSGDEKYTLKNIPSTPAKLSALKVPHTRKKTRRGALIQEIFKNFPEVRSIVFLPMWDFSQDKWLAGMLLWTCQMGRLMDAEDELPYLKAFSNSLVIEAARLSALHAERAKTTFIASISHELRSPLHGVLGATEFLQDTPLNQFQKGLLTSVETCGKTLLDTIDHVLDHAKINNFAGKSARKTSRNRTAQKVNPYTNLTSELDLSILVEEVVETIFTGRAYKKAHDTDTSLDDGTLALSGPENDDSSSTSVGGEIPSGVAVMLSISKEDDWSVLAQSGALRRVVMNLFGNALKYTDAGFVEISLRSNRDMQQQLSRLAFDIKVTDSGKGMSEEYLKNKLFQPFSQENPFAEGTGLGLSIVHQIVDTLKGKILVKSQQGVGTDMTVSISLPMAQTTENQRNDLAPIATQTQGLKLCLVTRQLKNSIHSAEINKLMERSIRETCEEWFGMTVYQQDNSGAATLEYYRSLKADFYLSVEPIPSPVLNAYIQSGALPQKNGFLVPLFIICANSYEATMLKKTGLPKFVKVLSQPCGPRKLAKVFDESLREPIPIELAPPSPIDAPKVSFDTVDRPKLKEFPPISEVIAPSILDTHLDPAPPLTLYAGPRPEVPSVELPAVFSPSPEPSQADPLAGPSPTRVLIVDDNEINQQLLVAFMKKARFQYACASNGLEALETYVDARGAFDYVLMDISMPVMDGLTSTRRIRAFEGEGKLKKANIIALTGLASASAREEALASGVDRFLTKPVKFKELKVFLTAS